MTILQPIANPGWGCDGRDGAKPLVSLDAGLVLIAGHRATVAKTEIIPLAQALGRVLASPVLSRGMSPPFDNAPMDGYAVATQALTGDGPLTAAVVARVPAGQVRGAAWLGLPGNPLSAFVTWQLFAAALPGHLTGATGQGPARRHVVTATAMTRKAGRCKLRPARCAGFDGQARKVVAFEAENHSAHVRSLPDADGLIFLPADCDVLPAGALVAFQPFCQTKGPTR